MMLAWIGPFGRQDHSFGAAQRIMAKHLWETEIVADGQADPGPACFYEGHAAPGGQILLFVHEPEEMDFAVFAQAAG